MSDKEMVTIEAREVVDITPMTLIQQAQTEKASVEQMAQLFELQLRYEGNEARKAYNRAIAEFKAKNIKIIKKSMVDFTSSKGRTNYRHANLADAIDQIIEALSQCGLSNSWKTTQENKMITVTCRISHIDGHHEDVSLTAEADTSGNKNSIQAIGSTVTYLERYTLKSALGLAEHDDDGKGADPEPPDVIDECQLAELEILAENCGVNIEKFCVVMQIPSLNMLPKSWHTEAVKRIESKRGKS